MKVNWKGVFPAMTTQFRKDESVDMEATTRHPFNLSSELSLVHSNIQNMQ